MADISGVADREDMVEFRGMLHKQLKGGEGSAQSKSARKFLSVWFRCCHTYGRMTRNKEKTAYEGRCPKCGAKVRALIGARGTNRRMFEAM